MQLSGWGNYPVSEVVTNNVLSQQEVLSQLDNANRSGLNIIPRGLGRSYGDSALATSILSTNYLNHFLNFDESAGVLTCQAGISLCDILDVFVPKGWFFKVTPGTKFISLGGAVASDVHGKNHHIDGCFSEHVLSLKVATINQGIVECSRQKNAGLFHATCGGMGLTGIILEVTFKLLPIKSAYIEQTTLKAQNLEQALNLFDEHQTSHYSVAWIDCLATGKQLGRSLIMLGEHANRGELHLKPKRALSVPFNMPSSLLNSYSIRLFNSLYYHRVRQAESQQFVDYESFFYPLDGISNWNRMYGKKGFCQYQCVIPKKSGFEGMTQILKQVAKSKRGSFLAVLKAFGKENKNYLSFPMEGYTLALDFKVDQGLFILLDELDKTVMEHGGRLYLTKDARMHEYMFKHSYKKLDNFIKVRQQYGADKLFHSAQSKRLGI